MKKRPEATINPGRHAAECKICSHLQRDEIEHDFVNWRSPASIAKQYELANRASVYRHAHAFGLFPKRQCNVQAAPEKIIERVGEVEVPAPALVAAIQAYSKINASGQWVDRSEHVDLNALFEKMTAQELEVYAQNGATRVVHGNGGRNSQQRSEGVKTMDKGGEGCVLPATKSRARPAEFPLGSLESRAAARALLASQVNQTKAGQREVYSPGWSPKTTAQKAALDSLADILFFDGAAGSLRTETMLAAAGSASGNANLRSSMVRHRLTQKTEIV